ncbi:phosphate transporter 4;5 [Actinidia rufa]|uniref:Phosphate transporter 45 n=1 Tax=Actinidia rufa TaxID=165716 RepID=A0A7J0DI55_9ERIC|nr:phosphate transporter 4;5 [Actinidia rufa]
MAKFAIRAGQNFFFLPHHTPSQTSTLNPSLKRRQLHVFPTSPRFKFTVSCSIKEKENVEDSEKVTVPVLTRLQVDEVADESGSEKVGFDWTWPPWKNLPQRYKIIGTTSLAFVICNMDKVNLSVAIIPMSHQFGWNSSMAGLVQSSFFWGYALSQLPGGWLAKIFGGRKVLKIGVLTWSLATALVPFLAGFMPGLILSRILVGIGEGVSPSAATDLIARHNESGKSDTLFSSLESLKFYGAFSKKVTMNFLEVHASWSHSSSNGGCFVSTYARVTNSGILWEPASQASLGKSKSRSFFFAPALIQNFGWGSVFYIFGLLGIAWYSGFQILEEERPSFGAATMSGSKSISEKKSWSTSLQDLGGSIKVYLLGAPITPQPLINQHLSTMPAGRVHSAGPTNSSPRFVECSSSHHFPSGMWCIWRTDQEGFNIPQTTSDFKLSSTLTPLKRRLKENLSSSVRNRLVAYLGLSAKFSPSGLTIEASLANLSQSPFHYGARTQRSKIKDVPWMAFFKSEAVWAMIYTHFCGSWGHYTCLSWLPTYFSEELNLNLTEAAWVSVLPPLASIFATSIAAQFADNLISNGVETTTVRKICQSVAFLSPAICMILASLDLGLPPWEMVMILTGGLALSSFALSGLYCTHQDISPEYASILLVRIVINSASLFSVPNLRSKPLYHAFVQYGVVTKPLVVLVWSRVELQGITNTVGAVPGIVGVALTGYLLDSTHSWSISLFAPSIFFYLTGTIVWLVFASSKPQSFSMEE